MLPIFYINLATRPDRRAYMENQLATLGLTATRIEAVTPSDISAADLEEYCNSGKPTFLRPNELACTLSHESAWRALLDSGHSGGLILEDDVELSQLLPAFLAGAHDIDADLIRVETTGNATRVFPATATSADGVAIRPFRSTPMGSAGYIIKAKAARRIIGSEALRRRHMDLALYSPFDEPGALLSRVLSDPAMCRQLNMTDQKTTEVARSDIADHQEQHAFAQKHPIRFFMFRFGLGLKKGLRNAIDHFAQQSKGLERKVIPFGRVDS